MTDSTLNELAALAQNGDLRAVEQLLARCQRRIYAISLRMLDNAADAEDAAQEILVKITTSLGGFRGDSDFMTWAHRIAVNHLLSLLRGKTSDKKNFDALAENLAMGLRFGATQAAPAADEQLLAYQVFVECAQRMLQCLDAPNRLALVLVDICDLGNDEAAAVLEIGADALRQRLSRARRELADFLSASCGLVNPDAPCHCTKQIPAAIAVGSVRKDKATVGSRGIDAIADELRNLRELAVATRMLRQLPPSQAPASLVDAVRRLLNSDKYRSLH